MKSLNERRFKGKFTDNYEFVMSTFSYYPKFRTLTAEFLNKFLKNNKKKIILEIGCGTGDLTKEVLNLNKNIMIFALDIEPEMINKAKERLKNYKSNKLSLITQDALDYLKNLKDESLDLIISSFTLHNFNKEYRNKVLREIFRVLKISGKFINTDKYALDDASKDKEFFDKQIKKIKNLLQSPKYVDLREMLIKHEHEDIRLDYIIREGDYINQLKGLGFKSIKNLFRENREAIITAEK